MSMKSNPFSENEMSKKFKPVTSREYKLILNVDRFGDRMTGCKSFWRLFGFLSRRFGGDGKDLDKNDFNILERKKV